MLFSGGKPAWILKYETKTPIKNLPELREEAEEIWELYKSEVEGTGKDGAILSANEPKTGAFISYGNGYNFVITKQPDGTWKMLEK